MSELEIENDDSSNSSGAPAAVSDGSEHSGRREEATNGNSVNADLNNGTPLEQNSSNDERGDPTSNADESQNGENANGGDEQNNTGPTTIVQGQDFHPTTVVKLLGIIFCLLLILLIALFVSVQRKQARARQQLNSLQLEISTEGLLKAVLGQSHSLVKHYLDAGIDRDLPNLNGWSPLGAAASRGDLEMIRLLVSRGASIDGPNHIILPQAQTRLIADEKTSHLPVVLRQNCLVAGSPPIITAAVFGRLNSIELLLNKGAQVDQATPSGWSALMCAIASQQLPVINALITRGAALTHESVDASTPIAIALDTGNRNIVSVLTERGARLDALDSKGRTLLARLSSNPKADIALAELLIDKGVDINFADHSGKSPLHYALESGNVPYTKLLLESGASTDLISKNGNTPLMYAAHSGNPEIVALLIRDNEDLNKRNFEGKTAWEIAESAGKYEVLPLLHPEYQLYAAISAQNLDLARKALAHGAQINVSDTQGISPLILALSNGRPNLTKYLLRTETDPNYVGANGQRAKLVTNQTLSRQANIVLSLMERLRAAKSGSSQVASPQAEDSLFSELSAPPDIVLRMGDKTGIGLPPSSMRSVFRSGKTELLQLLLLGGARVDMPDTDGNTPLLYAVQASDSEHVNMLLEQGADYEASNDAGLSPLLHAVNLRNADIAERMLRIRPLRQKGANSEKILLAAATGGLHGVAKSLLEQGVNPRVSDRAGREILFLAVARGDYDLASLLINFGATLSFEDQNVRALYINAKHEGKKRLISFLEQHAIDKQLIQSPEMKRDEKMIYDQRFNVVRKSEKKR